MEEENNFLNEINIATLLSLVFFLFGLVSIYGIANNIYSISMLSLLLGFIFYFLLLCFQKIYRKTSQFNDYLENLGSFFLFCLTPIFFGLVSFKDNFLIIFVLFFFSFTALFSQGRNLVSNCRNTIGFPLPLNGIFFPIFYYTNLYFLGQQETSTFFIYYLVFGFLALSKINFIGFQKNTQNIIEQVDKIDDYKK